MNSRILKCSMCNRVVIHGVEHQPEVVLVSAQAVATALFLTTVAEMHTAFMVVTDVTLLTPL